MSNAWGDLMNERVPQPQLRHSEPGFIGKILIVALVVALIAAVWELQLVFILGFGGVIVAVALYNLSAPLAKRLHISLHFAIALTSIGLGLVFIGFLAAFGARTAAQFSALIDQLPGAWEATRAWLNSGGLGRWLLGIADSAASSAGATIVSALPLASGVLGWLANTGLILVIGIYLAMDSSTYLNGVLRLLPPAKRERAGTIMYAAGADLRKWLVAMVLDMLFLGTVTGVLLWVVGAPFPFPLAVLSGLSVFVPYIGPIIATIPGLLLALSVSPTLALWAAGAYLIAQQLEGNISLPLLQRWTVQMPPVVSLLAIVAFGLLFGVWGVLLATPLAVVTMTVVRMAYVEDFLEKP